MYGGYDICTGNDLLKYTFTGLEFNRIEGSWRAGYKDVLLICSVRTLSEGGSLGQRDLNSLS